MLRSDNVANSYTFLRPGACDKMRLLNSIKFLSRRRICERSFGRI